MKNKRIIGIIIMLMIGILVILPNQVNANRDIIVILDPGHGGAESGAVSGGVVEKDVTWKIARRVKEILDGEYGITGILTRGENENPSLYQRGLLAKNMGADLLVSFHINASTNTSARGSEVYITGNPNSPRFNQSSNELAKNVLYHLNHDVGVPMRVSSGILRYSTDGELYSDGYLSDYYGIIRNPMYYGIPGVLIEHCYITNPNDRASFLNDWAINQMAEADAKAIIEKKESFRINKENNFSNSAIDSLTINDNRTHLVGEVTIVDWINGMQTTPSGTPSIKLKSTDGTSTVNCYATQMYGNKYYFDVYLASLDDTKEYKIEITTQDTVNIPNHPTSQPGLGNNRMLGDDAENNYYIENGNLIIENKEYVGDLTSEIQSLKIENINGTYYATGEIMAIEWVNGQSKVPRKIPRVKLKSTDGTITRNFYVKQIRGNTYYFDHILNGIDIDKEYIMEIASENPFNLSTHKKQIVDLSKMKQTVGKYQDQKVKIEDNKIAFEPYTYIGDLNTELYRFTKAENNGASYVSGEIVVVEWVDGQSTVPTKTPKMKFISTDGIVDMEVFVTATGTNTYYFDRYIEGIDTDKEYQFIVESTDSANISQYNKVPVYFKGQFANKEIGNYHDLKIKLKDNKITFTDGTYRGDLNTQLYQFNKGESNGASYISGEIVVVEWVDGQSTVPTKTPKMRFQSIDGEVDMEVFVTATGTNTYYFDRYIEGIDTTKEYRFIVESTDANNVSQYNKVPVYFKEQFADKVVGMYKDAQIILENNRITFKQVISQIKDIIEEPIEEDLDIIVPEIIEPEVVEVEEDIETEQEEVVFVQEEEEEAEQEME